MIAGDGITDDGQRVQKKLPGRRHPRVLLLRLPPSSSTEPKTDPTDLFVTAAGPILTGSREVGPVTPFELTL
jgi:hypothetical protein